jgi:putative ABC transport system ATP-binding protein
MNADELRPVGVQEYDPVIKGRRIEKEYGTGESVVRVLKSIDISIGAGEMVAIMGPSGSGKSTLLGILSGLDTPTAGQVVLNGRDITKLNEAALATVRNESVGFIFQTFNLIAPLTAQENVELPVQFNSHSKLNSGRRAKELLNQVGLSERAGHRPSQLSGGEQQRVAIARALANRPPIIFADEPTGNLDSANGETIMTMLRDLNSDLGVTVVIVTHDPRVAGQCHRIVHLLDGEVEHVQAVGE